jgi:hypothetical protein
MAAPPKFGNGQTAVVPDAENVKVDDSGFVHIVGTDVQTCLDSVDSQLGGGGGSGLSFPDVQILVALRL